MKNILKKVKDKMNTAPTPYHNRLSWKIILPRFLNKFMKAIVTLFLQCIKIFIVTVLCLSVIAKLIDDNLTIGIILSFYYLFLLVNLLILPFLEKYTGREKENYFLRMCTYGGTYSLYEKNGLLGLTTVINVERPYEKVVYKLVPIHNYGYVWNKFAEIADIFDPITYHLYDDCGNRISNAILDRKSWDEPSLLKDVEGD